MWGKYPRQNPDTPARSIEGEAIVITPDDSKMHNLNPTATFVWDRADGNRKLEIIFQEMLAEYDVEEANLREDILLFIHEAHDKGMLDLCEKPNPL